MDTRDKTSIALVKPGQLVGNDELSLGANRMSVDRAKNLLVDFGAVLTPVVRPLEGQSTYKVLYNQNAIKAMKEAHITEIPIVIADGINDKDEKILSLKLSRQINDLGALAQGSLIDSLIREKGYTLGRLSNILGVSKSWLSKRQSLVRNLSDPVKGLVSSGDLSPRTAEEVAKLPGAAQIGFAMKVIKDELPKDRVAKIVAMYNDPMTTDEIRAMILDNPSGVPLVKRSKPAKARARPDGDEKLDASLRFTVKACLNATKGLKDLDVKKGRLPDARLLKGLREAVKELSAVSEAILRCVTEREGA